MATSFNPALKQKSASFFTESMQFRRKEGKIKPKKIQRKIRLKFKHIIMIMMAIAGIFLFIQQGYLFLISWDMMNVKNIEITCAITAIQSDIEHALQGKQFGNILLMDIQQLQEILKQHRWIKDVQVRKSFPSTLKIHLITRVPVAVLQKDTSYLIDRDGKLLQRLNPDEKPNLPLLFDRNNFQKDFEEKLRLAWDCLDKIPSIQEEMIQTIDLSEYGNLVITLKDSSTRLIIGSADYSKKIDFYVHNRTSFQKYGPLDYIDLRFYRERLIIKPLDKISGMFSSNANKGTS